MAEGAPVIAHGTAAGAEGMSKTYRATATRDARDIDMILAHLRESVRDGWYYGNRAQFANRRDKLIGLMESLLPADAGAPTA